MLWGGWSFIVTFVLLCVVGVSYGYVSNHGFMSWLPRLILLSAICAMMSGFGVLFVLGARTAALFLDVDVDGFRFDFGDRRPWTGLWMDPGLQFQLVTFFSAGGNPSSFLAWGGSNKRAYLTEEAFSEVVKQATANGLRLIESRPARNPSAAPTTFSRQEPFDSQDLQARTKG